MRVMRSLVAGLALLSILLVNVNPGRSFSEGAPAHSPGSAGSVGPLVTRLGAVSDAYWARVAGRDTGLPPHLNGHDEFVADWTRHVLASLHGLPVSVVRQPFSTPGFPSLKASRPGVNVLIVVPGAVHPDRAIVVGAHPDGEPFSHGSAYDDTSGCIIVEALAGALGAAWRTEGLPSITVEFALFDAEEQGLVGSSAYLYSYRHHAVMPRPVLMIDEEQNGVGYPVRPFGSASLESLHSYAITTGTLPEGIMKRLGPWKAPDHQALSLAARRLTVDRAAAFRELRSVYPSLAYRGEALPAFRGTDESSLEIGPLSLCCSDNAPFEALGLPTVTFAGDASFYSKGATPWAYPFDQPEDTLQSLACDTGGSPRPSLALETALELPLRMSIHLVRDYAPSATGHRSSPVIFSSTPVAARATLFNVVGAAAVSWKFGDGSRATGTSVAHTYVRPGIYRVTVISGRVAFGVRILVSVDPGRWIVPLQGRPPPVRPWAPVALSGVAGCH